MRKGRARPIGPKEHAGLLRDGREQPKGQGRVCGKCGAPGGLREERPGEFTCIYCGNLEFSG